MDLVTSVVFRKAVLADGDGDGADGDGADVGCC